MCYAISTYSWNACMIGQHETIDTMSSLQVGRLFRQKALYTSWTPRNKCAQLSFSYAQQTFVHLRRVHFALNYIQYGYVTVVESFVFVHWDHHVFGLQQATHHVKHCCFSYFGLFFFVGEWRVRGRQKVETRRRYERRNQADQVIVHVTWIAEWRRTRGHDRGHELIYLCERGRVYA